MRRFAAIVSAFGLLVVTGCSAKSPCKQLTEAVCEGQDISGCQPVVSPVLDKHLVNAGGQGLEREERSAACTAILADAAKLDVVKAQAAERLAAK